MSHDPAVQPQRTPSARRTAIRRLRTRAIAIASLTVASWTFANDAAYDVDAATGYRMERYRAPVPDSVPGGSTLDNEAALALHRSGTATFIDVYPPRGLGADPLDGRWIISESHETLPGAIWLPEVGRGHLDTAHADYLERNLARLSGGDSDHPLVFFCTADCWQSWNAARRVASLGFEAVHWYPLGTDGWRDIGQALVTAQPINFLDDTLPDTSADANALPERASIFLVEGDGTEHRIGTLRLDRTDASDGPPRYTPQVELDGEQFEDQFLSMRPFRCITHTREWYCHLPYPYEIQARITPSDLVDLEYQLLFIRKRPDEFGIDAWNGLYYALEANASGQIHGRVLEGDLNVLAEPPEPDARPIDLAEFIDDGSSERRFPTLLIRP